MMKSYKRIIAALSAAAILATSVGVTSFADDSAAAPLIEIIPVVPDPEEPTEEAVPTAEATDESTVEVTDETAETTETAETAESTWESVEAIDYSAYLQDDLIPVYPPMEDGSEYVPDYMPENVDTLNYGNASSSYYNLAKENRVSSVRNQNPYGTCWAHAALASAESNMITKGYSNTSVDYSEAHLAWFGVGPGPSDTSDPLYGDSRGEDSMTPATAYNAGGLYYDSIGALARWSGAELESTVPYSVAISGNSPAESTRYDSYATLVNATVYAKTDISGIKNCLVNNGAMQVSYYHDNSYFNYSTSAYYCTYTSTNHAVTVVGWDDNYAVSNFKSDCRPSSKGAWIIKNSWGSNWGDDGYFYLSYEDTSISNFISYEMEKKGTYNKLYQYDGSLGMHTSGDYIYFDGYKSMSNSTSANVFTATASDNLSAVGFYTTGASVKYKVTVFTGVSTTPNTGKAVYTTSGTMDRAGYHTVKVSGVKLTKGQKFAVAVTFYGSAYHCYDKYNGQTGISYKSATTSPESSTSWTDTKTAYGASPCIKAYTTAAVTVSKPTNVKAVAGDGRVTVTWTKNNSDKYAVYSYLNGKFTQLGTTTGNSYTVNGLVNGTKYGFMVRGCLDGVWSNNTSADVVYATPISVTMIKPVNVKATSGNGSATITWDKNAYVDRYVVYSYIGGKFTQLGTTTGTSYTVNKLTNGTKYGFMVRGVSGSTWSQNSTADVVYVTPVTIDAIKPKNVKATSGNGSATITWDKNAYVDRYVVYSYIGGKFTQLGATTGTSYTVNKLTNGTKYGFMVRGVSGSTWSQNSTADVVYVTPVTIDAIKPKNVKATSGNGSATITWDKNAYVDRYVVYSYIGGKFTQLGATTGTSYTVNKLTNGTKYGFMVRGVSGSTWSQNSTADVVYVTPVTIDAIKPKNVKATAGNGSATITWDKNAYVDRYVVYSYIGGKFTQLGATTGTSYTVNKLTNGTKYGFMVRGVSGSTWSQNSTADVVYVTPVTSALLKVQNVKAKAGNGSVTVSWSKNSYAEKYAVYTYVNGKFNMVGYTTSTSYTVSKLTNGTKYGFMVRGICGSTWSQNTTSDVVYATPKAST